MGEAADMVLDGLLCQFCGELIDGEETGYPRTCAGCGGEAEVFEGSTSAHRRKRENNPDMKWIKIHDQLNLEKLIGDLQKLPEYTSFTEGKRDKFQKPVCFLGHEEGSKGYVRAHIAVWFKDEILEADGMQIIREQCGISS